MCNIKSNSIPRSVVERKQRRKRTKMCKKLESKLDNILHLSHNSQTRPSSATLPVTESTPEPVSTISLERHVIIPKKNNEPLVYL